MPSQPARAAEYGAALRRAAFSHQPFSRLAFLRPPPPPHSASQALHALSGAHDHRAPRGMAVKERADLRVGQE